MTPQLPLGRRGSGLLRMRTAHRRNDIVRLKVLVKAKERLPGSQKELVHLLVLHQTPMCLSNDCSRKRLRAAQKNLRNKEQVTSSSRAISGTDGASATMSVSISSGNTFSEWLFHLISAFLPLVHIHAFWKRKRRTSRRKILIQVRNIRLWSVPVGHS